MRIHPESDSRQRAVPLTILLSMQHHSHWMSVIGAVLTLAWWAIGVPGLLTATGTVDVGTTTVGMPAYNKENDTLYIPNFAQLILQVTDVSMAPLTFSSFTPGWAVNVFAGGGATVPTSETTPLATKFTSATATCGWPYWAVNMTASAWQGIGSVPSGKVWRSWAGIFASDASDRTVRFINFEHANNVTIVAGVSGTFGKADGIGTGATLTAPGFSSMFTMVLNATVSVTALWWTDQRCIRQGVPVNLMTGGILALHGMLLNVTTAVGSCTSGALTGLAWNRAVVNTPTAVTVIAPFLNASNLTIAFISDNINYRVLVVNPMFPQSVRTVSIIYSGASSQGISIIITPITVSTSYLSVFVSNLNAMNVSNYTVLAVASPDGTVTLDNGTFSAAFATTTVTVVRWGGFIPRGPRGGGTMVLFVGVGGVQFYCCLDASYNRVRGQPPTPTPTMTMTTSVSNRGVTSTARMLPTHSSTWSGSTSSTHTRRLLLTASKGLVIPTRTSSTSFSAMTSTPSSTSTVIVSPRSASWSWSASSSRTIGQLRSTSSKRLMSPTRTTFTSLSGSTTISRPTVSDAKGSPSKPPLNQTSRTRSATVSSTSSTQTSTATSTCCSMSKSYSPTHRVGIRTRTSSLSFRRDSRIPTLTATHTSTRRLSRQSSSSSVTKEFLMRTTATLVVPSRSISREVSRSVTPSVGDGSVGLCLPQSRDCVPAPACQCQYCSIRAPYRPALLFSPTWYAGCCRYSNPSTGVVTARLPIDTVQAAIESCRVTAKSCLGAIDSTVVNELDHEDLHLDRMPNGAAATACFEAYLTCVLSIVMKVDLSATTTLLDSDISPANPVPSTQCPWLRDWYAVSLTGSQNRTASSLIIEDACDDFLVQHLNASVGTRYSYCSALAASFLPWTPEGGDAAGSASPTEELGMTTIIPGVDDLIYRGLPSTCSGCLRASSSGTCDCGSSMGRSSIHLVHGHYPEVVAGQGCYGNPVTLSLCSSVPNVGVTMRPWNEGRASMATASSTFWATGHRFAAEASDTEPYCPAPSQLVWVGLITNTTRDATVVTIRNVTWCLPPDTRLYLTTQMTGNGRTTTGCFDPAVRGVPARSITTRCGCRPGVPTASVPVMYYNESLRIGVTSTLSLCSSSSAEQPTVPAPVSIAVTVAGTLVGGAALSGLQTAMPFGTQPCSRQKRNDFNPASSTPYVIGSSRARGWYGLMSFIASLVTLHAVIIVIVFLVLRHKERQLLQQKQQEQEEQQITCDLEHMEQHVVIGVDVAAIPFGNPLNETHTPAAVLSAAASVSDVSESNAGTAVVPLAAPTENSSVVPLPAAGTEHAGNTQQQQPSPKYPSLSWSSLSVCSQPQGVPVVASIVPPAAAATTTPPTTAVAALMSPEGSSLIIGFDSSTAASSHHVSPQLSPQQRVMSLPPLRSELSTSPRSLNNNNFTNCSNPLEEDGMRGLSPRRLPTGLPSLPEPEPLGGVPDTTGQSVNPLSATGSNLSRYVRQPRRFSEYRKQQEEEIRREIEQDDSDGTSSSGRRTGPTLDAPCQSVDMTLDVLPHRRSPSVSFLQRASGASHSSSSNRQEAFSGGGGGRHLASFSGGRHLFFPSFHSASLNGVTMMTSSPPSLSTQSVGEIALQLSETHRNNSFFMIQQPQPQPQQQQREVVVVTDGTGDGGHPSGKLAVFQDAVDGADHERGGSDNSRQHHQSLSFRTVCSSSGFAQHGGLDEESDIQTRSPREDQMILQPPSPMQPSPADSHDDPTCRREKNNRGESTRIEDNEDADRYEVMLDDEDAENGCDMMGDCRNDTKDFGDMPSPPVTMTTAEERMLAAQTGVDDDPAFDAAALAFPSALTVLGWALAKARFPDLTVKVFIFGYQGVAFQTIKLLSYSDATAEEYAMGVLGAVLLLLTTVVVCVVARLCAKQVQEGRVVFLPYTAAYLGMHPLLVRFLFPSGFWVANYTYRVNFPALLTSFAAERAAWAPLIHFIKAVGIAFIVVLRPNEPHTCSIIYICLCVAFLLLALLFLIARPHRFPTDNYFGALVSAVTAMLVISLAVDGTGMEPAAILDAILYISIVGMVLSFGVTAAEHRKWIKVEKRYFTMEHRLKNADAAETTTTIHQPNPVAHDSS